MVQIWGNLPHCCRCLQKQMFCQHFLHRTKYILGSVASQSNIHLHHIESVQRRKSKCCCKCVSQRRKIIRQTIEPLDLCLGSTIVGQTLICHSLHPPDFCQGLHKPLIWNKLKGFGATTLANLIWTRQGWVGVGGYGGGEFNCSPHLCFLYLFN